MSSARAFAELADVVRKGGLAEPRSRGVVLVSGGPDSACVAAGLAEFLGADALLALHLNHGLRESADRDERICVQLCELLGVELLCERPRLGEGNLQAAAREVRYTAAERLRARTDRDWIATGHTRTDVAETMIYRLATSPGRRALLGLSARRGRVIRPLLELERPDARRLALQAGLPFTDDPTNVDPRFARNRIRADVLPVLRELSPAAERNISETRAELAEESEALAGFVGEFLRAAGAGSGTVPVRAEALAGAHPAIRRLALRALAERAAGHEVPLGRARAAEIWRLASDPEGGEVDLGGGVRAICEHGLVRFSSSEAEMPEPTRMPVPGGCRFGRWEIRAELRPSPVEPAGPEVATLDAGALGRELAIRGWRHGDRMRPLGMSGTKSLQDLFTDRGVPRSLRRTLPIVVAGERIAWVAGVAVSEEFKLTPGTEEVAILTARLYE